MPGRSAIAGRLRGGVGAAPLGRHRGSRSLQPGIVAHDRRRPVVRAGSERYTAGPRPLAAAGSRPVYRRVLDSGAGAWRRTRTDRPTTEGLLQPFHRKEPASTLRRLALEEGMMSL